MRILICEDDPLQQEWLASRLRHEGDFVCVSEQGDQALAAWQEGRPWDFVVTDYSFIPGEKIKNGLDLVREIHSVDPSQRIIVQSGQSHLVVPPDVRLLRKPYSFRRVVRTMTTMQTLSPMLLL